MATDGFEFIEYSSPAPQKLALLFQRLGFEAVARHRSKAVTLYRQGDINFILNDEPDSHAQRFRDEHGPSACAMAFRVRDAGKALQRAVAPWAPRRCLPRPGRWSSTSRPSRGSAGR